MSWIWTQMYQKKMNRKLYIQELENDLLYNKILNIQRKTRSIGINASLHVCLMKRISTLEGYKIFYKMHGLFGLLFMLWERIGNSMCFVLKIIKIKTICFTNQRLYNLHVDTILMWVQIQGLPLEYFSIDFAEYLAVMIKHVEWVD